MTWTPLHSELHKTLRQRSLLPKDSRILIAVSGGQDSVCLLKLLVDLQEKWGWTLAIAHCDHGWRLDAGIAEHVQTLAHRFGLPCHLQSASGLKETEAAARVWRYQALVEMAEMGGFNYIVTGHSRSDRAETFLYNLMRGSGSDGLQSLGWQRHLTADIQLIRPLLGISRQETGDFCRQFDLPLWQDAYNDNPKYARNRIRQELIPYLQDHFNPQIERALSQTVELLDAEVTYLEELTTLHYGAIAKINPPQLDRQQLRALPLALQRRVIRRFLQELLPQAPNFEQIEAIAALITAPNRSTTPSLPGHWLMRVEQGWIVAQQENIHR